MTAFNAAENITWQPETMIPALTRLIRDPQLGIVLIAREQMSREAIGYCLATFGFDIEFSGADAFVAELFVTPRARRLGVGRELLDRTVDALRSRDVLAVHLMVRPENVGARKLYESRSFKAVPRLVMTRRLDGDAR